MFCCVLCLYKKLNSTLFCRTRPVFRHWRDMPKMSLVSAFTLSCPLSSPAQRMVSKNPTRPCTQSHTQSIAVASLPNRPLHNLLFVGTVRIWHSSTYRLESTLNYGMERVWCVCGLRGSNNVALGYDEGSIIIKVII